MLPVMGGGFSGSSAATSTSTFGTSYNQDENYRFAGDFVLNRGINTQQLLIGAGVVLAVGVAAAFVASRF